MDSETQAPVDAQGPPGSLLAEFEAVYRAEVGAVTGFFARRCQEPEAVADLTSETFARAAGSFERFDRRRGTPRAWLYGIARRVYADQAESWSKEIAATEQLAGRRTLDGDEFDALTVRIDAQRAVGALLERLDRWPAERAALELVNLVGLTPREAAQALDISVATLRVRLFRARSRLRTERSLS